MVAAEVASHGEDSLWTRAEHPAGGSHQAALNGEIATWPDEGRARALLFG